MADHRDQISELADIMQEFGLSEARISVGELSVGFKKRSTVKTVVEAGAAEIEEAYDEAAPAIAAAPVQKGTPISSPMTGIFYASPNPSSPAFVKEGDVLTTGQIVGLIEAMKVFNEVPCPISGTVVQIVATSGQLVNLGDPLLFVV